jgi:hypothetical protein
LISSFLGSNRFVSLNRCDCMRYVLDHMSLPDAKHPPHIISADSQMVGGSFCMQAAHVQTSSQPISQEDLQIPLGRSADPTRIAATCLVLTRDKRLILPLKKKIYFLNAIELIWELNFLFMYSLNQLPETSVCAFFSTFNIKNRWTSFLQSLKEHCETQA